MLNYRYDATHTASGYYQITNTNWLAIAPTLGIDTTQYPTAISAPFDAQTQVASNLLAQPNGIQNWSNYNPQLASALNNGGGSALNTNGGGSPLSAPTTYGYDPTTGAQSIPTTSTQDPGSTATATPSSTDWFAEAKTWISGLASRGALFVIGLILLIGAVIMFAKHEAS